MSYNASLDQFNRAIDVVNTQLVQTLPQVPGAAYIRYQADGFELFADVQVSDNCRVCYAMFRELGQTQLVVNRQSRYPHAVDYVSTSERLFLITRTVEGRLTVQEDLEFNE